MTRKTITYKGLSIRDPAPYGEAGLAWQNNFIAIADTLDSLQGSLDTALGGLVIGVDIQAYSANLDTWSSIAPSADAQALASAADYAAMRGLLGLEPGTDIQAHSANLDTWSSIAPSADAQALASAADYAAIRDLLDLEVGKDVQAHSANLDTWSSVAPSANGQSLVAATDYTAMRGLLDLVVGTDIQAHSANLDTWSGVSPSADGQSLVAAVDYAAMRGLLGVRPGADVQGYSAALGAIAGLTPTDGNVIVGDGTTWVAESGATARTSLGFTAPILDRAAPGDIGEATPGTGKFTTLETTGAVSIGGAPEAGFPLKAYQVSHDKGFKIVGYDTQSSYYYFVGVGQYGNAYMATNGYLELSSGTGKVLYFNAGGSNAGGNVVLFNGTIANQQLQIHGRDTAESVTKYGLMQVASDGSLWLRSPTAENLVLGAQGGTAVTIAPTGELSIPSDTVGLKLDAAGTTTLTSNGTLATLNKPLKAVGYQSSDGTAGATADVAVAKVGGGTRTLHFKNGLYTGYTDS